ncbi:hypothetical protein CEXT_120981 [Caerostris extrusa]|uniref:Uncharacterized protein n=1 Tax=Caerostris extrusa TaxID=172846 RepID=A0AAV4XU66_CAEEX|nr:hypothetical protein CEXT_120981 [Caerostris extrusa]
MKMKFSGGRTQPEDQELTAESPESIHPRPGPSPPTRTQILSPRGGTTQRPPPQRWTSKATIPRNQQFNSEYLIWNSHRFVD